MINNNANSNANNNANNNAKINAKKPKKTPCWASSACSAREGAQTILCQNVFALNNSAQTG
jgi:hypothetical protein